MCSTEGSILIWPHSGLISPFQTLSIKGETETERLKREREEEKGKGREGGREEGGREEGKEH